MTNKWHDITKEQPTVEGYYLCVIKIYGTMVYQVRWWGSTKNIWYTKPKHKHWFTDYDSEWGYVEVDNVVAWKEIEEYHNQKTTDL